jgi:hypothetical protein
MIGGGPEIPLKSFAIKVESGEIESSRFVNGIIQMGLSPSITAEIKLIGDMNGE